MKNLKNKINLIQAVIFVGILVGMATITVKGAPGPLSVSGGGTGTSTIPSAGQLLIGNETDYSLSTLIPGLGIAISNGAGSITIANNGVLSLNGTSNQVNVSSATGTITLSLPQNIATSSSPTFSGLTLNSGGITFADATTQTSAAKNVPVATVISYAATTTPNGWLLANGSAVSRSTYSDLFSAIGTIYGAGDGSTTFNLPNLQWNNLLNLPEAGLIGNWHMEGNSNDSSGNNYSGADTAVTYGTSYGKYEQGANFNGTNSQIITSGNSFNLNWNDPFTVSMWTNFSSIGNNFQVLASKGTSTVGEFWFEMYKDSNDKIIWKLIKTGIITNQSESINNAVVSGKWYLFTGVSDGTKVTLYINGEAQQSQNLDASFSGATQSLAVLHFGAEYNNSSYLNGNMDEVRVYKRALSQSEIQNMYSAQSIHLIKY